MSERDWSVSCHTEWDPLEPQMSDELFRASHRRGKDWEWITTEFEPVWDAADLVRCGRDIFFQRSHTTNEFGIEWLRRHLGDKYRVHQIEFEDDRAVHIDATFMPLAPGKLLVNPDRPARPLPDIFAKAGWECASARARRTRNIYRRSGVSNGS